jgi:hypothetical protein
VVSTIGKQFNLPSLLLATMIESSWNKHKYHTPSSRNSRWKFQNWVSNVKHTLTNGAHFSAYRPHSKPPSTVLINPELIVSNSKTMYKYIFYIFLWESYKRQPEAGLLHYELPHSLDHHTQDICSSSSWENQMQTLLPLRFVNHQSVMKLNHFCWEVKCLISEQNSKLVNDFLTKLWNQTFLNSASATPCCLKCTFWRCLSCINILVFRTILLIQSELQENSIKKIIQL